MSDQRDEILAHIAHDLSLTYSKLAMACGNLPVPVAIPTGSVSNVEAIPAVRRVAELAEDVTMPVDQQAQLFASCCFWLGAMDIYGLLFASFHDVRAHSALANLIMANESLEDLLAWLRAHTEMK
ncbi:hypothetical protein HHL19_16415 [Streptomyces sp. R302]|uniref:hypothetical protein n=1 Tax=unclassified Streptomyces TaxID=2593676 RepID=UPI00145F9135|nr:MULTISPECIES: hypothetical protein [unclassified Streptomyces]NML55354.1 hypothetical protein [Streptomyces sp. R301]NML80226.1 hypothetical protein [Streptomyces sp. R302]